MRHLMRYIPGGDMVHEGAWGNVAMTALIALVLIFLPVVHGFDGKFTYILLFVGIYAIMALGLNCVVGYTGLLELGYVTFFATGAFITVDLLLLQSGPDGLSLVGVGESSTVAEGEFVFGFRFSYLLIILLAGLVCAALGVVRGIPTLRLTGDYYAIVTLGLAEIVFLIYLNWTSLTGGAFGIKLPANARPRLFGDEPLYWDSAQFYYLVMLMLALTIVVMHRLSRSRIGRAWAAIRLDETAAKACGIDVNRSKLIAFGVSGFFGGVGGALYAVCYSVAAKSLDVWQSILILCAVVLGGMGSLKGVLLGSLILFSLREALREQVTVLGLVGAVVAIGLIIVTTRVVENIWARRIIRTVVIVAALGLFSVDAGPSMRVPPEASFLVYGLLLVFVMRFRPQGLLPRGTGESQPMKPEEEEELRATSQRLYAMKVKD